MNHFLFDSLVTVVSVPLFYLLDISPRILLVIASLTNGVNGVMAVKRWNTGTDTTEVLVMNPIGRKYRLTCLP
ncbi:MAG: hypothetical protein M3044_07270 [Thermoproteota archaeon]|nr:hypothetical protein [Thermoproteota archaeon]